MKHLENVKQILKKFLVPNEYINEAYEYYAKSIFDQNNFYKYNQFNQNKNEALEVKYL